MKKSDTENNVLIGFFLFLGTIFWVYANGITSKLFTIGFWVNFVLAMIYSTYKKDGCFRKSVIILRVVAITILVLMILAPVTLMNFKNTKFIYPLKRFCYGYGVYSDHFNNDILPYSLPKKCDDYMFITQGCMVAQDYHASAYLAFHTDSETLKKYENHFDSLNDAERQTEYIYNHEEKQFPEKYEIILKCPEELPRHVFDRFQPEHIHDFEKAIIYTVPSYYDKGCMLDYDSGLAVFWY